MLADRERAPVRSSSASAGLLVAARASSAGLNLLSTSKRIAAHVASYRRHQSSMLIWSRLAARA
jgi:hypothetical protein